MYYNNTYIDDDLNNTNNELNNININNYNNMDNQNNLDIVGLQEVNSRNKDVQGSSKDFRNNIKKNGDFINFYVTEVNMVSPPVIFSKYTFEKKYSKTFSSASQSGEKRAYIRTDIVVNGVTISFYDTHLTVNSKGVNRTEYRKKQLTEIAKDLADNSNPTILVGDFNQKNINEWLYILPSGNEFYAHNRHIEGTAEIGYTDSIIVNGKGKLSRISSQIIDTSSQRDALTDHNLVIAKISVANDNYD